MKEVAILGAGPSGLAAAKSALECGLKPVVFEQASWLGGLWRPDSGSVWFSMHTNLSKYSCMFSDFAWPPETSIFPSQRDIYQYLNNYAAEFKLEPYINFNTQVLVVKRQGQKWFIQWREDDRIKNNVFEFVIVATGIFSQPYFPKIPGIEQFKGMVIHGGHYKSPHRFTGKKVLVIGGAFSGAEIAADISQVANQVISLVRTPFWVIPRHIPLQPAKKEFRLPVDLVFYNRKSRSQAGEVLFKTADDNKKSHAYFQALCGDQEGKSFSTPDSQSVNPTQVAISDHYVDCVKTGKIAVKHMDIVKINENNVEFSDESIEFVDSIIFCTGYRTNLSFLDKSILQTINFKPDDPFQPILLHQCTFHPALTNMAFVGMYRGPYFAVMELQARWANMVFSNQITLPTQEIMSAGIEKEKNIREQKPRPQFPHGDYVGMADEIARQIGVFPDSKWLVENQQELKNSILTEPVFSAHYRLVGPHAKPEFARQQIKEVARIYNGENVHWNKHILSYAVKAIIFGLGIYSTFKVAAAVKMSDNAAGPSIR